MRNLLLLVGALVVGLVVGAWQPRGEVLRLTAQLDSLRAKQARCVRGSAAAGVRELLKAEPPAVDDKAEPPRRRRPSEAQDRGDPPADPQEAEVGEAPAAGEAPDPMAAITVALDARAAQARAALAEQGDLSDAQLEAVDRAVADMNARLKVEVDTFVAEAIARGDVERRDLLDFAAESLDAVIAADDGLRAAVGDEAYAEIDAEALDPFSYISGDTLASLAKLEDMPLPEDP